MPRGGVPAAIEGDRYILTLSGILGDQPPTDPAGFEAFAATLVFPDIGQVLQGAEPLDDPVAIRFPAGVRRRDERLRRFRLVNAYLARLQAAAASDASPATAFIRVVGMLDRPETLLRPDRVIRVLRAPRHPACTS